MEKFKAVHKIFFWHDPIRAIPEEDLNYVFVVQLFTPIHFYTNQKPQHDTKEYKC